MYWYLCISMSKRALENKGKRYAPPIVTPKIKMNSSEFEVTVGVRVVMLYEKIAPMKQHIIIAIRHCVIARNTKGADIITIPKKNDQK